MYHLENAPDYPSIQIRRFDVKKTILTAILITYIVAGMFTASTISSAAEATSAIPQLNLEISLTENLIALKGKVVTVTLSSGQAITGTVKDAKNGLLHLEKLSQKDFYDAVILTDKISAIEVRVR
jgi:hypothetical protein